MVIRELYRQMCEIIAQNPESDAQFEANQLVEFVTGKKRIDVMHETADEQTEQKLMEYAQKRKNGYPLQYIIGIWQFFDLDLYVGEGVLVPREDTLALVELGCEGLARRMETMPFPRPLRILDLCAGTGAVGLAAARRLPDARVTCVELSAEALPYLRENVEKYGGGRVSILEGDVLAGPASLGIEPGSFDAILSNPPYIPANDIPSLAREVRQEPVMALDGGADGLDFYRAIASLWKEAVVPGGLVCFELGEGQFEDVKRIIVRYDWGKIGEKQDFSGKLRAIIGTKLG